MMNPVIDFRGIGFGVGSRSYPQGWVGFDKSFDGLLPFNFSHVAIPLEHSRTTPSTDVHEHPIVASKPSQP